MSNEFEEKLHEILTSFQIGITEANSLHCVEGEHREAYHKIKSLIKESMPKKRDANNCGCMAFEGCGCSISDFNDAIESMENKLGVDKD